MEGTGQAVTAYTTADAQMGAEVGAVGIEDPGHPVLTPEEHQSASEVGHRLHAARPQIGPGPDTEPAVGGGGKRIPGGHRPPTVALDTCPDDGWTSIHRGGRHGMGRRDTRPAQEVLYIGDLPQASSVSVCPTEGLSTKDESKDFEKCLQGEPVKSVLIVTSDFHTRRALDIFRRELPGRDYSAAAVRDDTQFGTRWWRHRQWAKTLVDEWMRLIWWKVVDQWR